MKEKDNKNIHWKRNYGEKHRKNRRRRKIYEKQKHSKDVIRIITK
jgi:hypothetical protein